MVIIFQQNPAALKAVDEVKKCRQDKQAAGQ